MYTGLKGGLALGAAVSVAGDAFGVELLGRTLADVPYILMAEKAGAGQADYRRLDPVRVDTKA